MQVDRTIFKIYDIRGIWGKNLTPEIAQAIGQAFATFLKPKKVVVGRDVRTSGPAMQTALVNGLRAMGVAVTDIGVVTSDGLYFAVWKYGFDGGAMVTASHNPPEWNGIKFTRQQAQPVVGPDNAAIGDLVVSELWQPVASSPGAYAERNIRPDYVAKVLSFAKFGGGRRLKMVVDPGNGTAIRFLPDVMAGLPVDWQGINMQPDGNFPGRDPNPLAPGALDGLAATVREARADVGVAFDADADRMFFVDEHGHRVSGDVLTALLAREFLKSDPGATVVYNLICSHVVPEEIKKMGGRPIRSPVGHAHIKPLMRQHRAVFGGEISGHFFFRDFNYVDSGLVAMVVGLAYLSHEPKPLSELVRAIDVYAHTAEVNTSVNDVAATLARIKTAYPDGKLDELDGVTIEFDDWWFNVRPSNTEPLVRLSVEAKTPAEMEKRRDEVLRVIRG